MFSRLSLFWILLVPISVLGQEKPPPMKNPEWAEMLAAILQGSKMGPGEGWFHPSEKRHDFVWLGKRFDENQDRKISTKELKNPELFKRLDRDGDGSITTEDMNWADNAPYFQQLNTARLMLRKADESQDGKLTEAEWLKLFREFADKDGTVNADTLRKMMFPPQPQRSPSIMPSTWTLVKGWWLGELGSVYTGPAMNDLAPDFRLESHDGKRIVELKQYRHQKPVVLIFGSFT
jgi:Ca2+-binding EF-hand superfamily protein